MIQINIHRNNRIKTNSFTFILLIHWQLKEHLFSRTCQVTSSQYAYVFFEKSKLFCCRPPARPTFHGKTDTNQTIDCGLEKKHPSGLELLVSFTFINFFLKMLFKNIIHCQTAYLWTIYLCTLVCKNICQASLPLLLPLLAATFCLDQCQRQSCSITQYLCHWQGVTPWHINLESDSRCHATFKCNICPTSCIEISLCKKAIRNNEW